MKQNVEDISKDAGFAKHEFSTLHIKIYCKLFIIKDLK